MKKSKEGLKRVKLVKGPRKASVVSPELKAFSDKMVGSLVKGLHNKAAKEK